MDRRRFLDLIAKGFTGLAVTPKAIFTGPSTTLAPPAVTEIAEQVTTPPCVSLNQLLRVFENAQEGLDHGFSPDMTIGELLGKAPASQIPKKTKSQSSPGNDEALRIEAIRRILAAITNSAQHLSGQIHALANKKAA